MINRSPYLLVLLLFLTSCASAGLVAGQEVASQPDSLEGRRQARLATGEKLWRRCRSCHGPDGRAQTAFGATHEIPDFTSPDWRRSRVVAEMMSTITNGSGALTAAGKSRMPANGDLSEEEVRSLITYISALGS